jgi:hypothetical protein
MGKLCTNKNAQINIMSKICKNLSRNDFTIIFWTKYGFGWLYRDFFLHFPILLTDDCILFCCYEWFLFLHNLNTTNKIWFSYVFQLKINPKHWQSWENYEHIFSKNYCEVISE